MRLLFAVLAVAGPWSASPPPHPLDGTSWQLISMESMSDDEHGTTPVDDPGSYTVTLGADGHASFRIDCNRGSGTWQATAASPDFGSLTSGPIAVTRMMCPQPSLEHRVSTALGSVEGYQIVDGGLRTPLMSDAGTLIWEPSA